MSKLAGARRPIPSLWCVLPLGLALAACNHIVRVHPPATFAARAEARPLGAGDKLRFPLENLGEVEAGFCFRSAQPGEGLIRFLAERWRLGYSVDLRLNVDAEELAAIEAAGGRVVHLPMHASRPPSPRQILELIRATLKARDEGRALLIHCRRGADRTGAMVAIWRMLFQGFTDREALKRETLFYGHVPLSLPNVHAAIDRFRPELFRRFIENPALLDDAAAIADLESRYFHNQPLHSGSVRVASGALQAGAGKAALLEGWQGSIPMATYGPLPGDAKELRHPVFARALILDNGALRVGIVSCDLLIIDLRLRDAVFDRARERGLALDDLLLQATHTHTSVGGFVEHWLAEFYMLGRFRPELRDHLVERIVQSLLLAQADLRPARLGAGRTFVQGLSHNRRFGSTVDEEVGLIRIDGEDGRTRAALLHFAAHPVLEPNDRTISPDYPGHLAAMLDARFGFGLFLQGALGDLNAKAPGAGEGAGPGRAEAVARALFEAAQPAIEAIATRAHVELGSLTSLFEMPPPNVSVIPDLLFPLELWLSRLMDWPPRAPLQCVRLGDVALVAAAAELDVRLGHQIKRASPSPFPFLLTHANSYAGYAVAPTLHARTKLDPTSVLTNNGASYGARVVASALDLLETQWGRRIDRSLPRLSPAEESRLGATIDLAANPELYASRAAAFEEEILERADATLTQTRRSTTRVRDSLLERARLEVLWLYLEDVRGGDNVKGRVRDLDARLSFGLPLDLRLDAGFGYRRSDWAPAAGDDDDDGAKDLLVGVERPIELVRSSLAGNALRLSPRLELSAPVGDPDPRQPFALAPSSGVWRPGFGAGLEFVWDSYRTLFVEGLYATSTERRDGRRPGDLLDLALGYRERHGLASIGLDWAMELRWPDRRRGGRTLADVEEFSYQLGLRPSLTFHLGEHVDLIAEGILPAARSGAGAGEGEGMRVGLVAGF